MKTAIFIDGGYLSKVMQIEFNLRVDFEKLSNVIANGREILRTYYYNCLPYQSNPSTEEERKRFSKAQSFFRILSRLPRYEVRLGRLARRGSEFQQKGVDTLLSIDIVNLAASGKIIGCNFNCRRL